MNQSVRKYVHHCALEAGSSIQVCHNLETPDVVVFAYHRGQPVNWISVELDHPSAVTVTCRERYVDKIVVMG